MLSRFVLALVFPLVFLSCKKESINVNVKTDTSLANTLRSSATNLTIGNNSFFLTTLAWRSFMPSPGSATDGSYLICQSNLTAKDSLPIPSDLKLIKQYVLNSNEIWTSDFKEINNYGVFKGVLNGTVRDGPKWEPGIFVDVVCEFTTGGSTYRIIAKQQQIIAMM